MFLTLLYDFKQWIKYLGCQSLTLFIGCLSLTCCHWCIHSEKTARKRTPVHYEMLLNVIGSNNKQNIICFQLIYSITKLWFTNTIISVHWTMKKTGLNVSKLDRISMRRSVQGPKLTSRAKIRSRTRWYSSSRSSMDLLRRPSCSGTRI